MIKALWRHVAYNYREGGFRQILQKIAGRIRQWIRSDEVLLVYRHDFQETRLEPQLPLAESILDYDALVAHRYFKTDAFPEAVRKRLASGSLCHGLFLDRELVNIGWTSRGFLELVWGVRILDGDSAAIYDCYTLPAFRSRGIYADSLIRMLRQIRDEGVPHALIAVAPDNIPSVRAIEKVGFRPLYLVTISQRFGRKGLRESKFSARFRTPS